MRCNNWELQPCECTLHAWRLTVDLCLECENKFAANFTLTSLEFHKHTILRVNVMTRDEPTGCLLGYKYSTLVTVTRRKYRH